MPDEPPVSRTGAVDATRNPPRRHPELISVVIPVRNGGEMLRQQLEAIAAQDYTGPWEVVVGDNASTDNTAEIVKSFANKLDLQLVLATELEGASYTRSVALKSTSGDFIAHCDADDLVDPGWLTAMAAAAAEFHLVGGRLDEESLNADATWRPRIPTDRLHRTDWLPYAIGANFGVWRETIDAVGGWNDQYHNVEDKELSYRIQCDGWVAGFAPDAVVKYRHRSGLWGLFIQFHHYGRTDPLVYRDHRANGHPRSSVVQAMRRYAGLLLRFPTAMLNHKKRAEWIYTLGYSLGRIDGSIRYRTLFL